MSDLTIFGGVDAESRPLDLFIVDGLIHDVGVGGQRLDATGLTAVPGFIDLQTNGGWGHDFTEDPSSIWKVGGRLPSTGVTAFCPTIITSPDERVRAAQRAMKDRPSGYAGAEPIGLHVEGPHLSERGRGTHPINLLRSPGESTLTSDEVAITTIAPELDGARELIERLTSEGVHVSIGHSHASASEANSGIDAGARLATHLFNAMPPITGREPGIAGAVLADQRVRFSLIVDAVHLSPETVRMAWHGRSDRVILITDAMAATGMPDGRYEIGSVGVTVADGAVRNDDGDLAGSVLTMDVALKLLRTQTGASLASAVAAATSTPAAAVHREDIGVLSRGARGDVVLLDGDTVFATVVQGNVVHLLDPKRLEGVPDVAS